MNITKALSGPNSDVWYKVAETLIDSPNKEIHLDNFGPVDDPLRLSASPKIAWLMKRGSQNLRLALGISEKRRGLIYGAVIKTAQSTWLWDPNYKWPKSGELWDHPNFNGVAPYNVRKFVPIKSISPAVKVEDSTENNQNDLISIIARHDSVLILHHDNHILVAEIKSSTPI